MREIVLSFVAIIVISVIAAFGLQAMDWSAQSKYAPQAGNVRLN